MHVLNRLVIVHYITCNKNVVFVLSWLDLVSNFEFLSLRFVACSVFWFDAVWILKFETLVEITKSEFVFGNTVFMLRWLWYAFYYFILGKMVDNQNKLRYGRVA